jgi:hypothetical protein
MSVKQSAECVSRTEEALAFSKRHPTHDDVHNTPAFDDVEICDVNRALFWPAHGMSAFDGPRAHAISARVKSRLFCAIAPIRSHPSTHPHTAVTYLSTRPPASLVFVAHTLASLSLSLSLSLSALISAELNNCAATRAYAHLTCTHSFFSQPHSQFLPMRSRAALPPLSLLLFLLLVVSAAVSSARRPHVVLFVVDDLGWSDVGYRNNSGARGVFSCCLRTGSACWCLVRSQLVVPVLLRHRHRHRHRHLLLTLALCVCALP